MTSQTHAAQLRVRRLQDASAQRWRYDAGLRREQLARHPEQPEGGAGGDWLVRVSASGSVARNTAAGPFPEFPAVWRPGVRPLADTGGTSP